MSGIERQAAKKMVGPGWAGLVEVLYNALPEGVMVTTVKEKFGGLRVYWSPVQLEYPTSPEPPADQLDPSDLVEALEKASLHICERCGTFGFRRSVQGWFTTLCDEHYQQRLASFTGPPSVPPASVASADAPAA